MSIIYEPHCTLQDGTKMTKKCHRLAKMYKNAGHKQRQTDR